MFCTEQELVNVVVDIFEHRITNARSFWEYNDKINVFTEVDLGYGIPDIVITNCKSTKIKRSQALNYFDVLLYQLVDQNPAISAKTIATRMRATSDRVKKSLNKLSKEGMIACKINETYVVDKKYTKIVANSLAIEAKLKNWQRALNQAYRYKWFSNRSFVCLPEANTRSAEKNLDKFRRYGVGLMGVNESGQIRVIYDPGESVPYCETTTLLLNEKLVFTH